MEISYKIRYPSYLLGIGELQVSIIDFLEPGRNIRADEHRPLRGFRDFEACIVNIVLQVRLGIDVARLYRKRGSRICTDILMCGIVGIDPQIVVLVERIEVRIVRRDVESGFLKLIDGYEILGLSLLWLVFFFIDPFPDPGRRKSVVAVSVERLEL